MKSALAEVRVSSSKQLALEAATSPIEAVGVPVIACPPNSGRPSHVLVPPRHHAGRRTYSGKPSEEVRSLDKN